MIGKYSWINWLWCRASMNKHSKKRNILHWLRGITDSYKIAVGPRRTALHLISLVLHGNIDKQSSLAYMWAWAEPFSFSLMYVPKKSSPVMKDTSWVWVLMKLQVLLLSLSTLDFDPKILINPPVFMAISGGAGECSKDWLFVWSPERIPIWCFFCRVLLVPSLRHALAMHPHGHL